MEAFLRPSLMEMATAVRTGSVSAMELTSWHLQHIAQVNPQLNAVVTVCAESAMVQARRADQQLARQEPVGPLHGVPLTIKDSLDTAAVRSTWGTPGRADFVPTTDATVVARLRQAGAILLGKTNTPELTLSYETDNPLFGRTNNPYDLGRTPGGSSGGAAAAVAAACSPADIGSDTGGSIRLPAHFCGIAGLKPTSGRVPRTGHAIGPFGWLNRLTQLGPMARTVSDLALILPLIAGPDGTDAAISPVPLLDPSHVKLADIRLAVHTDNGICAAENAVATAVLAAAQSLAEAGARVIEELPVGIEQSLDLLRALMRGADGGAWVKEILAEAGTNVSDSSLSRYFNLADGSGERMAAVVARWDRWCGQMLSFMQRFDAIICPVNAYAALPHGTFAGDNYPGFSYTMTYNLTGWPAAVVRCGTSPEGLPIGVQIVTKPWREDIALALAQHLEQVYGGWQPPPMLEAL